MYLALAAALGVLGIVALAILLYSLAQVLRLVAPGRRRRAAGLMLRWQFGAVAMLGGEATIPHANRYLRANMLLFGVIVCSVIIAGVKLVNAQDGGPDQLSLLGAPSLSSAAES